MDNEIIMYLDFLKFEKNVSVNTYKSYKNDLYVLLKFFKKNLSLLSSDDIKFFFHKYNISSKSKSHYISVINSFFSFLINEGIVSENPVKSIKRPRESKKIFSYLSFLEVDKLLDFPLDDPFSFRNKAMFEVMYASGLRVSELLLLKIGDVDFITCSVKIFGKGKKERCIPISDVALKYLNIYLTEYRSFFLKNNNVSDFIFLNHHGNCMSRVGFFKILKKRALICNITKDISPHTLRHSFATHLINNGADIRVIQEILGHEHLVTTQIYTHMNIKKIKNDYECHPHF